ncbi:MAG: right-handed parallel beta-helix repeat-containing protein [Gammaproteobacteria bacterium]|nr:right-handed parallel beta-helix repeat-containing protein [Gammaproteobacteria bacterium]
MQLVFNVNKNLFKNCVAGFTFTTLFLLMNQAAFAKDAVTLNADQIIDKPTTYDNETLNLTNGFMIKPGGILTIENSTVNIIISPYTPYFAYLTSGELILKNDTFNVTTESITPNPSAPTLYQLIKVDQGVVTATQSSFSVDNPFSVGFLTTNPTYPTKRFSITDNTIQNFHGGVYLANSDNAKVNGNSFLQVSLSNIFDMGSMGEFDNNIFTFPGNLSFGDAIDLVDSKGVNVTNNIIQSSSNLGIQVMGGQQIVIDNNKLTDGLSYAISIKNSADVKSSRALALFMTAHPTLKRAMAPSSDVTVSNNFIAQNRYGLTASGVDKLVVTNNMFIQKFSDDASRQFWTNNDLLLATSFNITWTNNFYKEAFTQDNAGDNKRALQYVPFPAHGGVVLP